jgi:hypothetical protein
VDGRSTLIRHARADPGVKPSKNVSVTSALPPDADIRQRGLHVRLVPEADINIAPTGQPRGPERLLGVGGTLFRFYQPLLIVGGELGLVDRQRRFVEPGQKDRDRAR